MSPHEQMRKWDRDGDPYVIHYLSLSNGVKMDTELDVLTHNEQWLQVRNPDGLITWINISHVISIGICNL